MVYSLKFDTSTGDWDFSDRRGRVVTGVDKLRQMLAMWVSETKNVDRFHQGYGSELNNMIGMPHTRDMQQRIENEIRTVCDRYIEYINQDFTRNPTHYTRDEIPLQVLTIQSWWEDGTRSFGAWGDAIHVTVYVKTMTGSVETLEVTV